MTPGAPAVTGRPSPAEDVDALVRTRRRAARLLRARPDWWVEPDERALRRRLIDHGLWSCYRDFERLGRLVEWRAMRPVGT